MLRVYIPIRCYDKFLDLLHKPTIRKPDDRAFKRSDEGAAISGNDIHSLH